MLKFIVALFIFSLKISIILAVEDCLLTTGSAILAYDPSTFQDLYDFPDVYHYSTQEAEFIKNALSIVDDTGLTGVVSVGLLHHHFQISDSEILVETQTSGRSVVSVYHRDDDVSKLALPYMFKLSLMITLEKCF